jgi:hypothetical protein
MAEKVGIDRSYISDMEGGKKNICLPIVHQCPRLVSSSKDSLGRFPTVASHPCQQVVFCERFSPGVQRGVHIPQRMDSKFMKMLEIRKVGEKVPRC